MVREGRRRTCRRFWHNAIPRCYRPRRRVVHASGQTRQECEHLAAPSLAGTVIDFVHEAIMLRSTPWQIMIVDAYTDAGI